MKKKPVWRLVLLTGAIMLVGSHGPDLLVKVIGSVRSAIIPWIVSQWKDLPLETSALESLPALWGTRTLGLLLILLGAGIILVTLVRVLKESDPFLTARRLIGRGLSEVEIGRATNLSRDAVRHIARTGERIKRHSAETISASPGRPGWRGSSALGRPALQGVAKSIVAMSRPNAREAVRVLQK